MERDGAREPAAGATTATARRRTGAQHQAQPVRLVTAGENEAIMPRSEDHGEPGCASLLEGAPVVATFSANGT
jgi:hypothetical protein